ncbi:hypothetical protein ACG873_07180 [Mesorhizobium sp. AaZ16]|uniref:hypothetical protein n=1 Tax=Mesorhizobium sp. AaZ16 TaxID=3402289 RepID=UPI00374E9E59
MAATAMTKPSQHHFNFDGPMAKENPSLATRAMDFFFPAVLGVLGIAVGYFFF